MDKNKRNIHNILSKTNIAILCALGMIGGFLVSRYVLSVFTIGFGVNALRNVHPREWLKDKWWLLGLPWILMYGVSYFWSDNVALWQASLEVKMPILLLPLTFSLLPPFSQKQLVVFTTTTAAMLLAGACYSSYFYLTNPDFYIEGYRVSQVLPTPARNEHIRFSLAIALFIGWSIYFFPRLKAVGIKWFMAIALVLLALYLHLLAARTGLVALYIILSLSGIYLGLKRSKVLGLTAILSLVLVGFISVKYIPTLKNRFGYLYYTYVIYKAGQMSGIYSDMGRFISYDIAIKKLKEYPLPGTGAGDLADEMNKGYAQWYPDVSDERRLLPHNQFLIVALACGIAGLVLFIAWILYPLKIVSKKREGFFFFVTWIVLAFSLMIEPALEIQFGVFVFLFFMLWQRKEVEDLRRGQLNSRIS